MSTPPEHACPGLCGRMVVNSRLACPQCWYRLPASMRAEVWAAWKRRGTEPLTHLRLVAEAARWFRRNRGAAALPLRRATGAPQAPTANRHAALYRTPSPAPRKDGQ